jgi:flagellar motor component MotA
MSGNSTTATTRITAALGLAATLGIAFSEAGSTYRGYFDLRAGLLVFAAPVLVLTLFQKQPLRLRSLVARLSRLRSQTPEDLGSELSRNSAAARGQYGFSHVARFSEGHADPLVRYAGALYSSRFDGDEIARLLTQRIQAEDSEWQAVGAALGFLTKMAPYFGMLATVIGMIKLLENMNDFTRISGSMALAMQGTLYGLLSFTLLYSPLQRYVTGCRDEALKRNELVARWFVLLAEQADPAYIERDMGSHESGAVALPVAGTRERKETVSV